MEEIGVILKANTIKVQPFKVDPTCYFLASVVNRLRDYGILLEFILHQWVKIALRSECCKGSSVKPAHSTT